jgi:glucose-6-phosphate isomerase, archaeal
MHNYITPFTRMVNLADGTIPDARVVHTRRLSDLKGLFADQEAEKALLADNPVLYRVYETPDNPEVVGQLRFSTSVIYPGKVGNEYFMTKGHYHGLLDRAEVYFGLAGEGYIILMTPEGEVSAQLMTPGAAVYVPPYWGHRTMNVGKENFAFFAVYPADAGYDYQTIVERGFPSIMVEQNGKPTLVPNPRYVKQP